MHGRNYTVGRVAYSKRVSHASASSRDAPHISDDGCRPAQKAGRSGLPNTAQRSSGRSCAQRTPAGLPSGMSGKGDAMEGATQQAAQLGRQINGCTQAVDYFEDILHHDVTMMTHL